MVDVLSGGRLEFGIGLGNTAVDFQVYGIPREESRDRFEEAAEVVLKAWTNERFNHEGRFWRFEDVPVYPRPVQQPTPPIWVAGLGGSPWFQHHDRGPSVPVGALRAGSGRLA